MPAATVEPLEGRTFLSAAPVPHLRAVTGTRDLLYVRVRFADQSSYPLSASAAATQAADAAKLVVNNSGGNLKYRTAVESVTLPGRTALYRDKGTTRIADDADAALQKAGVSLSGYEHVSYRFAGVPGSAGLGQVGGKRIWLRSNTAYVLAHEVGHNLGLYHSNLADPKGTDPFGDSTNKEYGDSFSNMGSGGTKDWSAGQKYFLGWLGGSRTKALDDTRAGTFTVDLASHEDATTYASGSTYLIRIKLSASTTLDVEYRKGLGGVLIHRTATSSPRGGALIDCTPGTSSASDAALKFGKSVTDKQGSGKTDDVKIAVAGVGSKARVTVTIGG